MKDDFEQVPDTVEQFQDDAATANILETILDMLDGSGLDWGYLVLTTKSGVIKVRTNELESPYIIHNLRFIADTIEQETT